MAPIEDFGEIKREARRILAPNRLELELRNHRMLLKRLIRELERVDPGNAKAAEASDFINRTGTASDILRDALAYLSTRRGSR